MPKFTKTLVTTALPYANGPVHLGQQGCRQVLFAPEPADAYVILVKIGSFLVYELVQQAEDAADFLFGAVPVFCRKSIQSRIIDF